MKRSAFTMIELIFAIVIISIVVLSMPMMMKTNQDAMEANVVQEALFASSAEMMQVLSLPWDTHSTDSTNTATYGKVVYVATGNNSYYRKDVNGTVDVNSSYRVGHVLQDKHRRFHDYTSADANVTQNITSNGTTALNNISANNISLVNLVTSTAGSDIGYKNDYKMDVNVSYILDASTTAGNVNLFDFNTTAVVGPTNMKLITVNINKTNSDGTTTLLTSLRSYSANIGEFDFAKRRF